METNDRLKTAEGLIRLGRLAEAEDQFVALVAEAPDLEAARFAYARLLMGQLRAGEALAQVERLLATGPTRSAYRLMKANILAAVGDGAGAAAMLEALLADDPGALRARLHLGHVLRTLGRREEAVAAYRACIAQAPDFGEAWWSLANLKAGVLDDADAAAIRALLGRADLPDTARLHLAYALGQHLEDGGLWGGAFAAYAEAARLRGAHHEPDAMTALVDRSRRLFTKGFFAGRAGAGCRAEDPIFVVGLPRAGSSLVEQILASHPGVEGVGEVPHLSLVARSLGPTYPDAVAAAGAAGLAGLGEAYLERVRIHRRQGRLRFVDKTPHNVLHLGLIATILPRAKIVDVRRHPMAAGFSAFKQHFAEGALYTYDLVHLGRYYRDYLALMDHFDEVLPGRVHRVIYEDLVADPEREVRRLLTYCGLPFDPACMAFHQTPRQVRTPSSEQVRRPIFREGLDHWRNFEPWLGPLQDALGSALDGWRGRDGPGGPNGLQT